jgi:hypothetical protein
LFLEEAERFGIYSVPLQQHLVITSLCKYVEIFAQGHNIPIPKNTPANIITYNPKKAIPFFSFFKKFL